MEYLITLIIIVLVLGLLSVVLSFVPAWAWWIIVGLIVIYCIIKIFGFLSDRFAALLVKSEGDEFSDRALLHRYLKYDPSLPRWLWSSDLRKKVNELRQIHNSGD